jgi:hypothetical protein
MGEGIAYVLKSKYFIGRKVFGDGFHGVATSDAMTFPSYDSALKAANMLGDPDPEIRKESR